MTDQAPTTNSGTQTGAAPAAAEPASSLINGGVLITGANGHLGQRLIPVLASQQNVVAVVRSANAAASLQTTLDAMPEARRKNVSIHELAYTDVDALRSALAGCTEVIHLAGILKESPWSSYQQAHEDTTAALIDATRDLPVQRISYLSIVGSHPDSDNACLASKGNAEAALLGAQVPALVLQVPMVLGEGDYAAAALNAQARRGINVVFAVEARDQPLYAGDVVKALLAATTLPTDFNAMLTLAGPEAVNKRELISRAAALLGNSTRVVGLPRGLAITMARVLARFSKNPPVTEPMMDILHHDDDFDPEPACRSLNVSLTSLDDMLELVLRSN